MPKTWTVAELADALETETRHVRDACESGVIPATRLPDGPRRRGRWRISGPVGDALIEGRAPEPRMDPAPELGWVKARAEWTASEIAVALRVDPRTVRRWCEGRTRREIETGATRKPRRRLMGYGTDSGATNTGGHWRVSSAELFLFLREHPEIARRRDTHRSGEGAS